MEDYGLGALALSVVPLDAPAGRLSSARVLASGGGGGGGVLIRRVVVRGGRGGVSRYRCLTAQRGFHIGSEPREALRARGGGVVCEAAKGGWTGGEVHATH